MSDFDIYDYDVCECGSTSFQAVPCPETNRYIDVCKECGNCGSHLCDSPECVSNNQTEFVDFLDWSN